MLLAKAFRISTRSVWNSPSYNCYRQRLCSSSSAMLDVPRTEHVTIGGHAFSSTAACVWNSLPTAVQSSESLHIFRRRLKTALFEGSYNWHRALSNDFTAAWLTFTFPQLFAVAATLKSIDYNVAMTFILNKNNNNCRFIQQFLWGVYAVAFFKVMQQQTIGKVGNSIKYLWADNLSL